MSLKKRSPIALLMTFCLVVSFILPPNAAAGPSEPTQATLRIGQPLQTNLKSGLEQSLSDSRPPASDLREKIRLDWEVQADSSGRLQLAITPDGKYLISGGKDRKVRTWDARSGERLQIFPNENGIVRAVSVDPQGRFFASAEEGQILVRSLREGSLLHRLSASDRVMKIGFSPDGRLLCSSDGRGEVIFWDPASGRVLRRIQASDKVRDFSFNRDGRWIAWVTDRSDLEVWHIAQSNPDAWKRKNQSWIGPWARAGVRLVLFDPVRLNLVIANRKELFSQRKMDSSDQRVWSVEEEENIKVLAASPGGHVLAAGLGDGSVRFRRLEDGRSLGVLKPHREAVSDALFDPTDAKVFYSAGEDGRIKRWNLAPGSSRPAAGLEVAGPLPAPKLIHRFDANMETGGARHHTGPVQGLAFSPDGASLISGGEDRRIYLHRTAHPFLVSSAVRVKGSGGDPGQEVPLGQVAAVAESPDGRWLASGDREGSVRLTRLGEGTQVWKHFADDGHPGGVIRLLFTPDGETVTSIGRDGVLRRWNASDGKLLAEIPFQRNGEGHVDWADADPSGRALAWVDRSDHMQLRVIQGNQALVPISGSAESGSRTVVRFSPAGDQYLSADRDNHRVGLYSTLTGEREAAYIGHRTRVLTVAFHPSGELLVSADAGGVVHLWHPLTEQPIAALEGDPAGVISLAFSPDGERLAAGDRKGNILLWDITPMLDLSEETLNRLTGRFVLPQGAPDEEAILEYGFAHMGIGPAADWPTAWLPSSGTGALDDAQMSRLRAMLRRNRHRRGDDLAEQVIQAIRGWGGDVWVFPLEFLQSGVRVIETGRTVVLTRELLEQGNLEQLLAAFQEGAFGPLMDPEAAHLTVIREAEPDPAGGPLASPVIDQQPQGGEHRRKSSVTLLVEASHPAGAALSYQWSKDGRAIPGATAAAYTIASFSGEDVGRYTVQVTARAGEQTAHATSYVAELRLAKLSGGGGGAVVPVGIGTPLRDQTVEAGDPILLLVTVTGTGPFRFELFRGKPKKGSQPIARSGSIQERSYQFSIPAVLEGSDESAQQRYTIKVTGASGSTSTSATVTIRKKSTSTPVPSGKGSASIQLIDRLIPQLVGLVRTALAAEDRSAVAVVAVNKEGSARILAQRNGRPVDLAAAVKGLEPADQAVVVVLPTAGGYAAPARIREVMEQVAAVGGELPAGCQVCLGTVTPDSGKQGGNGLSLYRLGQPAAAGDWDSIWQAVEVQQTAADRFAAQVVEQNELKPSGGYTGSGMLTIYVRRHVAMILSGFLDRFLATLRPGNPSVTEPFVTQLRRQFFNQGKQYASFEPMTSGGWGGGHIARADVSSLTPAEKDRQLTALQQAHDGFPAVRDQAIEAAAESFMLPLIAEGHLVPVDPKVWATAGPPHAGRPLSLSGLREEMGRKAGRSPAADESALLGVALVAGDGKPWLVADPGTGETVDWETVQQAVQPTDQAILFLVPSRGGRVAPLQLQEVMRQAAEWQRGLPVGCQLCIAGITRNGEWEVYRFSAVPSDAAEWGDLVEAIDHQVEQAGIFQENAVARTSYFQSPERQKGIRNLAHRNDGASRLEQQSHRFHVVRVIFEMLDRIAEELVRMNPSTGSAAAQRLRELFSGRLDRYEIFLPMRSSQWDLSASLTDQQQLEALEKLRAAMPSAMELRDEIVAFALESFMGPLIVEGRLAAVDPAGWERAGRSGSWVELQRFGERLGSSVRSALNEGRRGALAVAALDGEGQVQLLSDGEGDPLVRLGQLAGAVPDGSRFFGVVFPSWTGQIPPGWLRGWAAAWAQAQAALPDGVQLVLLAVTPEGEVRGYRFSRPLSDDSSRQAFDAAVRGQAEAFDRFAGRVNQQFPHTMVTVAVSGGPPIALPDDAAFGQTGVVVATSKILVGFWDGLTAAWRAGNPSVKDETFDQLHALLEPEMESYTSFALLTRRYQNKTRVLGGSSDDRAATLVKRLQEAHQGFRKIKARAVDFASESFSAPLLSGADAVLVPFDPAGGRASVLFAVPGVSPVTLGQEIGRRLLFEHIRALFPMGILVVERPEQAGGPWRIRDHWPATGSIGPESSWGEAFEAVSSRMELESKDGAVILLYPFLTVEQLAALSRDDNPLFEVLPEGVEVWVGAANSRGIAIFRPNESLPAGNRWGTLQAPLLAAIEQYEVRVAQPFAAAVRDDPSNRKRVEAAPREMLRGLGLGNREIQGGLNQLRPILDADFGTVEERAAWGLSSVVALSILQQIGRFSPIPVEGFTSDRPLGQTIPLPEALLRGEDLIGELEAAVRTMVGDRRADWGFSEAEASDFLQVWKEWYSVGSAAKVAAGKLKGAMEDWKRKLEADQRERRQAAQAAIAQQAAAFAARPIAEIDQFTAVVGELDAAIGGADRGLNSQPLRDARTRLVGAFVAGTMELLDRADPTSVPSVSEALTQSQIRRQHEALSESQRGEIAQARLRLAKRAVTAVLEDYSRFAEQSEALAVESHAAGLEVVPSPLGERLNLAMSLSDAPEFSDLLAPYREQLEAARQGVRTAAVYLELTAAAARIEAGDFDAVQALLARTAQYQGQVNLQRLREKVAESYLEKVVLNDLDSFFGRFLVEADLEWPAGFDAWEKQLNQAVTAIGQKTVAGFKELSGRVERARFRLRILTAARGLGRLPESLDEKTVQRFRSEMEVSRKLLGELKGREPEGQARLRALRLRARDSLLRAVERIFDEIFEEVDFHFWWARFPSFRAAIALLGNGALLEEGERLDGSQQNRLNDFLLSVQITLEHLAAMNQYEEYQAAAEPLKEMEPASLPGDGSQALRLTHRYSGRQVTVWFSGGVQEYKTQGRGGGMYQMVRIETVSPLGWIPVMGNELAAGQRSLGNWKLSRSFADRRLRHKALIEPGKNGSPPEGPAIGEPEQHEVRVGPGPYGIEQAVWLFDYSRLDEHMGDRWVVSTGEVPEGQIDWRQTIADLLIVPQEIRQNERLLKLEVHDVMNLWNIEVVKSSAAAGLEADFESGLRTSQMLAEGA